MLLVLTAETAGGAAATRNVTLHVVEKSVGFTSEVQMGSGARAYEGVTGSGKSVSRSENSPYSDDTLHLIWP